MPTLTMFIQHRRSQSIWARQIKGIHIGKEEVKVFLFVGDMIFYTYICVCLYIYIYIYTHTYIILKTAKKLVKKFSKVTGYKINTQKSVVFLYTDKEL